MSRCHLGIFPALVRLSAGVTRLPSCELNSHSCWMGDELGEILFSPEIPDEAAMKAMQKPNMMSNDFIMTAPIPCVLIDAAMTKKVARIRTVD